jgi:DNA-binding LacI/PurR family transcriptional regulator
MEIAATRRWSKEDVLYESLIGIARRVGTDGKLPTVKELRYSLRVSTSTLDRVLRQLEEDGWIIRKHGSGIYASPQVNQKSVGLIFGSNISDTAHSPFWTLLLHHARQYAIENDYELRCYLDIPDTLSDTHTHSQLAEDIEANWLDGLLLIGTQRSEQLDWLKRRKVPLVTMSQHGHGDAYVSSDDEEFMRLSVDALKQAGCRHLGLISGAYHTATTEAESLTAALQRTGLVSNPQWHWFQVNFQSAGHALTREEYGYELAKRLFGSHSPGAVALPDGLIIRDDTITRGALVALARCGWQVGRDIQIATNANKGSPVLQPYEHDMILIEYDPAAFVKALFELLDRLMATRPSPQNSLILKPTLRPSGG